MASPLRPVPPSALLVLLLAAAAGCGAPRPTEAPPIERGTALPPPGLVAPASR